MIPIYSDENIQRNKKIPHVLRLYDCTRLLQQAFTFYKQCTFLYKL